MSDKKTDAKLEAKKSKPEEKQSDDDLKAVIGGTVTKRNLHHGRITTATGSTIPDVPFLTCVADSSIG